MWCNTIAKSDSHERGQPAIPGLVALQMHLGVSDPAAVPQFTHVFRGHREVRAHDNVTAIYEFPRQSGIVRATHKVETTTSAGAGRFADGQLKLDGRIYSLAKNNISGGILCSLQGSTKGFDKVIWDAERTIVQGRLVLGLTNNSEFLERE